MAAIGSGFNGLGGRAYPALENSDFWGCLMDICQMYATMPVHVYDDDRNKIPYHPLLHILKVKAAPYMPAETFRFIMGFNLEIHGTALAIIEKSPSGQVLALYPVSPRAMQPQWTDGRLYWKYLPNGEMIADEKVLRITRTPLGYTEALSPIQYADRDLQTFRNSQDLQSNYYRNGASIGGILTVPRGTSRDIKEQLKNLFQAEYSGSGNGYKTAVLEDTMKYEALRLNEGDVSKLEAAQKWTREQILSRFYGISSTATYTNAEHQGMQKLQAVQPRFVLFEKAFTRLLSKGQYVKFNLEGLMRSDHATTASYLTAMVNNGIMTTNEARSVLDLPPIKGGDVMLKPLNYGTLNPDGTITNPNNTPSNPFDFPLDDKKEAVSESTRLTDQQYLEASQKVTRTNRSKVEAVMRKQIKAYISHLESLISQDLGSEQIRADFATFAKDTEKEYGEQYATIFRSVMDSLSKVVLKQVGSGSYNNDALASFSSKLGFDLAGRLAAMRKKDIAKAESDDWDDIFDNWVTNKPAEESEEETSRAGNAFQVFCFQELGLQYMHVVASGDSCEFCQALDGKVVEVNGNILMKGDQGTDGAGNVRTITKNYKHPPFHIHCHCGVAPGK